MANILAAQPGPFITEERDDYYMMGLFDTTMDQNGQHWDLMRRPFHKSVVNQYTKDAFHHGYTADILESLPQPTVVEEGAKCDERPGASQPLNIVKGVGVTIETPHNGPLASCIGHRHKSAKETFEVCLGCRTDQSNSMTKEDRKLYEFGQVSRPMCTPCVGKLIEAGKLQAGGAAGTSTCRCAAAIRHLVCRQCVSDMFQVIRARTARAKELREAGIVCLCGCTEQEAVQEKVRRCEICRDGLLVME